MELAIAWSRDAVCIMLRAVWDGYDQLCWNILANVDLSQADEDLERSITQLLAPLIRRAIPETCPFDIGHGLFEWETRKPAPAQPPEYDLAFFFYANPRVMWPLEAKILRTSKAVAPYVRDVQQQFLTCRYAPFSSEAAMLGYLVRGDPVDALEAIAQRLNCRTDRIAAFHSRPHHFSDHGRTAPARKPYPKAFRCHHLIMKLVS